MVATWRRNYYRKRRRFYLPLHLAIIEGDWEAVESFYNSDQKSVRASITENLDTPLMVAVMSGQKMEFITKLVELLPEMEDLASQNREGNTALHEAAIVGHVEAAKLLVEKKASLLLVANSDDYLPLHSAAAYGQREVLSYFLTKTDEVQNIYAFESFMLLRLAIDSRLFDVAQYLLQRYMREGCSGQLAASLLEKIAEMPSAFSSGTKFNIWQRFFYFWVPSGMKTFQGAFDDDEENRATSSQAPTIARSQRFFSEVWHKLHAIDLWKLLEIIVPHLKHVRVKKLMHYGAEDLVQYLCLEIQKSLESFEILKRSFLLGAKLGIEEIVEGILVEFPSVINCRDEEDRSALHLAVLYRHDNVFNIILEQRGVAFPSVIDHIDKEGCSVLHLAIMYRRENVFNIILQEGVPKELLLAVDCKDNNMLHLVGKLPYQPQLEVVSGAVLQMQRELQWYKEVEKLVPEQARAAINKDKKTPIMVFDEEHRRMIQSEQQWIVGMATACTVATTIIGTIAFAAAVQAPGGNNGGGHPVLYEETAFTIFTVSNAVALYSSISTFLIFLSIFTARYAAIDFLHALPNRLIIGLIALFLSVTSTIVAFGSAQYLMFSRERKSVILTPVVILSCIPLTLFAFFQFPLLLNMMKTTYGRSMFSPLDQKES